MTFLKPWRYLLLAPLAIAAVAAFSACGGDDSGGATNTPGASGTGTPTDMAPDSQQTLSVNDHAEPATLDPQAAAYSGELPIVHNTYVTLFDQDPKTSQLTPWAAAEVPTTANGGISADGLTYTIKLKPGLKFSDGTPLTAPDFVYGIIRGYNLKVSGAGYGGFISTIKGAKEALALDTKSATYVQDVQKALKDSVVAVDATTIKIVLAVPSASFLYNLFLPITAAVKQANVETLGDKFGQASGAAQMVTSGPFTMKEWAPKDHVTFSRNDNYTATHQAYLREVIIKFITDLNQAYNAFQSGQLDEAQVPVVVYPTIKTDPRVRQEPEFGPRWITVDVTLPPWDNKDFVIGMNQATDREAIVRDVYFGIRQAWAAPCVKAVANCDPTLFSNLEFNLDKAKASIAKAYPNGNIPAVTLDTVDDPTANALSTTLQQQWSKVGVTVNIVPATQKSLQADMLNHVSGTQVTGWSMDYADPTDLWNTKTIASLGATNFGFYSRPAYDKLVADQDKALDANQRKQLLIDIQKFYAADPADITFSVQLRTDIFNPKVKGMIGSPFDYEIYGDQFLREVYISKS